VKIVLHADRHIIVVILEMSFLTLACAGTGNQNQTNFDASLIQMCTRIVINITDCVRLFTCLFCLPVNSTLA